jgi:hypothetical protein
VGNSFVEDPDTIERRTLTTKCLCDGDRLYWISWRGPSRTLAVKFPKCGFVHMRRTFCDRRQIYTFEFRLRIRQRPPSRSSKKPIIVLCQLAAVSMARKGLDKYLPRESRGRHRKMGNSASSKHDKPTKSFIEAIYILRERDPIWLHDLKTTKR